MNILLIDHQILFREGLHQILRQLLGGVDEILEAENFPDGLKLAEQHPNLNLALLELKSPGCDGVMSVKLFHRRYPHIPLVVVSSEENYLVINKALSYGANGFVSKTSTVPILLNTLNLVLSGNIYVPPQFLPKSGMVLKNRNDHICNHRSNSNEHDLTARQMNILGYLAAGLSNKEIAKATNLCEGTVKTHIAMIYQVLRVNNRIAAMRIAKRLGLADVSDDSASHSTGLPERPSSGWLSRRV